MDKYPNSREATTFPSVRYLKGSPNIYSKDDFRWIREVFMTSTIGLRRMGRKLDLEKDEMLTLHLLPRDSQVGNVTAQNVVDAIEYSKRVIIILSA